MRWIASRLQRLLGPGWQSFAGIFLVTNLGLLAVGATLPVIPRFVSEELNGSDLEVADRHRGLRADRDRLPADRGAIRPTAGAAASP